MKILVLEDDEVLLTVVDEMLRALGHESIKASTFAEGAKIYAQNEFDIVLSDMRLGESSGLDFADWVANQNDRTRFILMTGYTEKLPMIHQSRAVHYILRKPFRLKELSEALDKVNPL